jgi:regulator of sigma E protease
MTGVTDLKPVVGAPAADSPAAFAGFRNGDLVKSVDGEAIATWTELRKRLLDAVLDRRELVMNVETPDGDRATRVLEVAAGAADLDTDPIGTLGLHPFRPKLDAVIDSVAPGSAAASAGLQPGDVIVAIDGEPIADWEQVIARINPAPGKMLDIEIARAGVRKYFQVVPDQVVENGHAIGRLGIAAKRDPARYAALLVDVRYGLFRSLAEAGREVRDTSLLSLRMMGRMVVGQISLKNLSGPVTIADYAGQSARLGISPYLRFIALISISLGVLNLLPVPVLDGGHLMYYLAELFKGSPLSDGVLEAGQKIGFGLLGLLMLLALYNDVHRLIAG